MHWVDRENNGKCGTSHFNSHFLLWYGCKAFQPQDWYSISKLLQDHQKVSSVVGHHVQRSVGSFLRRLHKAALIDAVFQHTGPGSKPIIIGSYMLKI